MTAQAIASLLLETEQPSGGDRNSVYVFGPGLPAKGHVARDMNQAIIHLRWYRLIPTNLRDGAQVIDELVKQGYLFLLKHGPGNVEAIGRIPAATTPEGAERARYLMGLKEEDSVAHRRSMQDAPKKVDLEQVLQGSRSLERATEQQAAPEGETVGAPAAEGAPGTAAVQSRPDPEARDFALLRAPIQIGITFDKQSRDGVVVMEVHPSGPAARAGVKAGDVLLHTGEFVTNQSRIVGPYTVSTPKQLEIVLGMADPQYALPIKVRRGGQELWLPIHPTKAETKQAAAAAKAAGKTSAPRQQSMTRKLFAGNAPAARQGRLKLAPNEPPPTRKSGNTPANVSALS